MRVRKEDKGYDPLLNAADHASTGALHRQPGHTRRSAGRAPSAFAPNGDNRAPNRATPRHADGARNLTADPRIEVKGGGAGSGVERNGWYWLGIVEGVHATQARQPRELDAMTRNLIAVMTDTDPDSGDIEFDFVVAASIQAHLGRAAALRQGSAGARSGAAAEIRGAAREFADRKLPLCHISRLLGVSPRAHVLARWT